jgi:hypothetical protein
MDEPWELRLEIQRLQSIIDVHKRANADLRLENAALQEETQRLVSQTLAHLYHPWAAQ